ncbi:MAG: site-specific DNA-methyltransferase, partial [Spirochaetia bacterium]|nr:site-specific DNA-methyltransferase [Spirochaetia bacterium]
MGMEINRSWSMPSRNTFTIKPIKSLLFRYVDRNKKWLDAFANVSKIANITNDLNPEYGTDYNLDALEFFKLFENDSVDGVLYDPPYSITQASQCYKSFGKDKLEINV